MREQTTLFRGDRSQLKILWLETVMGFWYIYMMKNKEDKLIRFITISETHEAFGLPKPQHPLISLVHFNESNPFNTSMAPI
jgi:AraC family transcriptional activator of pobA